MVNLIVLNNNRQHQAGFSIMTCVIILKSYINIIRITLPFLVVLWFHVITERAFINKMSSTKFKKNAMTAYSFCTSLLVLQEAVCNTIMSCSFRQQAAYQTAALLSTCSFTLVRVMVWIRTGLHWTQVRHPFMMSKKLKNVRDQPKFMRGNNDVSKDFHLIEDSHFTSTKSFCLKHQHFLKVLALNMSLNIAHTAFQCFLLVNITVNSSLCPSLTKLVHSCTLN